MCSPPPLTTCRNDNALGSQVVVDYTATCLVTTRYDVMLISASGMVEMMNRSWLFQ